MLKHYRWPRLLSVLTLALTMLLGCTYFDDTTHIPFDAAVWRAHRSTIESNMRMRMTTDLMTSRILIGKSRAEVIDLLGSPESPLSGDTPAMETEVLYYLVGQRWSGEWVNLVIYFEHNQVVSTEILG